MFIVCHTKNLKRMQSRGSTELAEVKGAENTQRKAKEKSDTEKHKGRGRDVRSDVASE